MGGCACVPAAVTIVSRTARAPRRVGCMSSLLAENAPGAGDGPAAALLPPLAGAGKRPGDGQRSTARVARGERHVAASLLGSLTRRPVAQPAHDEQRNAAAG